MALVLALKAVRVYGHGGRKVVERTYDVTFSGNYSGNGGAGDPIDFTSTTIMTNGRGLERARFANNPDEFEVNNHPPGFIAYITPGASLASGWGLRIYQSSAAGNPFTELSNGAYPAGLTGITAGVRVTFREVSK